MKKTLILSRILYLALSFMVLGSMGCHKSDNRPASNGTVDGGGGNVLCEKDGSQCSILDLVENKDRQPFDFDLNEQLEKDFKAGSDDWGKYKKAITLYNGNPDLKQVFGQNTDFIIWYLNQVMASNRLLDQEDKSLRFIGVEAFGLKEEQVKNLQFYFTEKEIPLLKDQGFLGIENPEDLRQVALQDKFGQVLIQKNYFSQLNFKNKYALFLHESLLFILLRLNPDHLEKNGTAKIRQFVNSFMAYHFEKQLNGASSVNAEKVASAFQELQIPVIQAQYQQIGEISDRSNSSEKLCTLKRQFYTGADGSQRKSANYYFARGEEAVSNMYAMDIEFMMKIQIYLVKRGLCIFKPKPCDIKRTENEQSGEMQGYAVYLNGEAMPEVNEDLAFVQEKILPKYRTARLCQ